MNEKNENRMNDLISRQQAVDALLHNQELYSNNFGNDPIDRYTIAIIDNDAQTIAQLPSAQPEQRWIPCSERMPETDDEVLITVLDMEDDYVEVYKGFYQGHEWWTQWCHGCLRIKDEPCGANMVTAWMPLPEPYQAERREE